jgi:hypothetical protein
MGLLASAAGNEVRCGGLEGGRSRNGPHAHDAQATNGGRTTAFEHVRGKTRAEVEALLGPDSKSDYFREYDLVYWLGAERGYFGIDSEWLVIKFASDGQVADVRLVTD